MLEYIANNMERFVALLLDHVEITLTALFISLMLGLCVGFLIYNKPTASLIMNTLAGGLRVIPSLVILLLLLPVLGTGRFPATIALIIIGFPTILGSTVQGLSTIPNNTIEAANACGMNSRQTFWQIRLPLALPVIITGARMTSLSVAAGATIAAYIGAGGLGELIMSGISQYRNDILLAGAVPVVIISMLLEIIFQLIYYFATPYKRKEEK